LYDSHSVHPLRPSPTSSSSARVPRAVRGNGNRFRGTSFGLRAGLLDLVQLKLKRSLGLQPSLFPPVSLCIARNCSEAVSRASAIRAEPVVSRCPQTSSYLRMVCHPAKNPIGSNRYAYPPVPSRHRNASPRVWARVSAASHRPPLLALVTILDQKV
jgi:hypothetical protein